MATYIQGYPNSCGAACLLCGAFELGVAQIPQNANYLLLQGGPTPLALNQGCEDQLYQVTSNNPGAINPNGWGYSMPSDVVACARMLGLQAWAIAYKTWSVRGLKIGYRDEMQALRAMNALVEHGANHSTFGPKGHQRELKVLMGRGRGNFGGMHYVMVRPNGSVMEPDAGVDHGSIQAAKTAVSMHGTGLSVFIQN